MMDKTVSTYAELYHALLPLDNEHKMHMTDDTSFSIRLDEVYDITVYDNRDGEVYLEYNANGKQLTHYHPDYQEAYEDLTGVLRNTKEETESLKRSEEAARKVYRDTIMVSILIILLLAMAYLLGGR